MIPFIQHSRKDHTLDIEHIDEQEAELCAQAGQNFLEE